MMIFVASMFSFLVKMLTRWRVVGAASFTQSTQCDPTDASCRQSGHALRPQRVQRRPVFPVGMPVARGRVGTCSWRHGGATVPASGSDRSNGATAAKPRIGSVRAMSDTGVAGAATATGPDGLTADEVTQRVRAGQVNVADDRTSRTLSEILRANVFTRFNAILGTAFVLILIFGEGQDSLFGFVLLFNVLIGVIQEWRAKRTLDRLAVLNAPRCARRARRRRFGRSP